MRVSVIIPTYNRSDVIIRSLQTWTKQTLPIEEYEVIVVDNNSTDNSADLIQSFIAEFVNFNYLLEKQVGSTNARHAGARMAKGEILLFCDDDGLFNPDCLKEILKVFESKQNIDAVAGKIEILWDKTPPEWIKPYEFMLGKLDYGNKIKSGTELYLNGGLFSIKKTVFVDFGGFNPDLVGNYLVGDGDTGLVIKLHKEHRLIGWTPYAIMQHLQYVEKQGTVKDLGRRFYNVGISSSYGIFRENNFQLNFKVLIYLLNSLFFLLKKQIEFSTFAKDKRKTYFSLMQRKGEWVFFWNLRKASIRNEVKSVCCYTE